MSYFLHLYTIALINNQKISYYIFFNWLVFKFMLFGGHHFWLRNKSYSNKEVLFLPSVELLLVPILSTVEGRVFFTTIDNLSLFNLLLNLCLLWCSHFLHSHFTEINTQTTPMEIYKDEQIEEKKQSLQASEEIQFLNSQINPHFIFNTLNNLFAMALKSNDFRIANGIGRLANLMRYLTYEMGLSKIDIQKEIKYIENYVELQKLRISPDDDITIKLRIVGDFMGIRVPPMLFINFIENAFKYGISTEKQSEIDILFQIDETKNLLFSVGNTFYTKLENDKSNENSGFGITNSKKRLELMMKDKYELLIYEENNYFKVILHLNLA